MKDDCFELHVHVFNFLSHTAFSYPFYGVQWHPEKNTFEWTLNENIPHSDHATAISQTAADFFVQEGKLSNLGVHAN